MSRIDEAIVREYFEGNGFFVRELRKYPVQGGKKTKDDEIHLLVSNPNFRGGDRRPGFLVFSNELSNLERAVVVVKDWNSSRLTPGMLKSSAKLFRFLEQNVFKRTSRQSLEGEDKEAIKGASRLWVLPGFPISEPFRSQAIEHLQSRGVDGIISFRSMLLEIMGRVEVHRDYRDLAFLEAIRVLKNYDLLRETQMELFSEN